MRLLLTELLRLQGVRCRARRCRFVAPSIKEKGRVISPVPAIVRGCSSGHKDYFQVTLVGDVTQELTQVKAAFAHRVLVVKVVDVRRAVD